MTVGPFKWFDAALDKVAKNIIRLDTHSFKAILVQNGDAISETFTGASTDCRYSDITDEVPPGGGYATGGVAPTAPSFSRTGNTVTYTANDISWTIAVSIAAKYLVIYDDTATNKDLLCFLDLDDGGSGGDVTLGAGIQQFSPNPGIVGWYSV